MLRRVIIVFAAVSITACHTSAPIEGDADHVTVSLDGAEAVAAGYCRMFGKLEQFRNMDTLRQTAMFDCVTRR